MKKLNNKGFTLVEVLAVIVIIALLGGIAITSILGVIDKGKNVTEQSMINNIKTASQALYEEIDFSGSDLYKYNQDGTKGSERIIIVDNSIEINLQTLVSNGFLDGTGEEENKIITNPKTKENIGACQIRITKTINDTTYETSYTITKIGTDSKCPNYYKEVT